MWWGPIMCQVMIYMLEKDEISADYRGETEDNN